MIRFATWSAVSTFEQVEGISLENQIEKGKARGVSEKWIDTNLQYVADGYSRTGYVDLSVAEKEIPPLGQMLIDMRANKFDVLVCWNYDRFGDLIVMVATEFRKYKKQLFSLSQPTPIQELYNPYMDDSSFIIQAFAPIWQRQRIADMRRKWEAGLPKRIKDGLPAGPIPYGYRFTMKNQPPEIVPAEAALVRNVYDLLMEGKSLLEIARVCNETGLKTKRGHSWTHSIVTEMMSNPFYAGIIQWPKVKLVNKKLVYVPMAQRLIVPGKHQPIFTEQEHSEIVTELWRRTERSQRSAFYYPFSGLIFCGKCERRMYRGNFKLKDGSKSYVLRDDRRGKGSCYTYKYDFIVPEIAKTIYKESLELRNKRDMITYGRNYDAEIEDVEARIERVQQSAEMGVYTPAQAGKRVSELRKEYEKLVYKQQEVEFIKQSQSAFDQSFDELEHATEWMLNFDPAEVNRVLSSIIEKIILEEGEVQIKWRGSASGSR